MGLAWEEVYLRSYLVHKNVLNFPQCRHLDKSHPQEPQVVPELAKFSKRERS